MLTEFKLPGLGENIKSGVVTKIMIKPGDKVSNGQPILELETDKAVLEVPSSISGVVKEILIKLSTEVKVGQVIMKVEAGAAGAASIRESPAAPPMKSEPAKPQVQISQAPAHIESPRIEQPAFQDFQPPGQSTIEVRTDVAAAPSVRRFAREIGIDVHRVPGSGPKGRISIEDVKAYAKALNTGAIRGPAGTAITAVTLPDFSKWGSIEKQPMSPLRKKAAEHLSYAWATIPHVTQFDKADITDLEILRKKFAKKVEAKGGKLTITPFLMKVIASALKNFPQFNATIDMVRNEVIYKKYYNIGIAVDTDRGLIVPVVKDVDKKGIVELAVELVQLSEKARNKKTTLEEMQGGTFTITNLGSIGGTAFTPIVNSPEVAILGVSHSSMEPLYNGNFCSPKLMLPLCLSYDHRVIDGADGARFLRWIIEAVEQPFLMELEG